MAYLKIRFAVFIAHVSVPFSVIKPESLVNISNRFCRRHVHAETHGGAVSYATRTAVLELAARDAVLTSLEPQKISYNAFDFFYVNKKRKEKKRKVMKKAIIYIVNGPTRFLRSQIF